MQTMTPGGVLWRGRVHRFAGAAIDAPTNPASQRIEANLQQHFASEVRDLDRADERRKAQRAGLLRPDGQPKYAPAEQVDREKAIAAEFEAVASRITTTATEVVEATRRELVIFDGADPFDRLTAEQQQRAGARQPFIREDVEQLPPNELERLIRAALASDDRVLLYLYARSLPRRAESLNQQFRRELLILQRDISERLADPKLKAKREAAERKLTAAQVLGGRVGMVRRGGVDGLLAAMKAGGFPRL